MRAKGPRRKDTFCAEDGRSAMGRRHIALCRMDCALRLACGGLYKRAKYDILSLV